MAEGPPVKLHVDPPVRLWRLTSWLLNQVAGRANRLVTSHFGGPGGRMRYAILAGLDQFGAMSQAELSRRLGIDRGDAVSGLNALERDGLVRRVPDRDDRRRNAVHITPAGEDVLLEFDVHVDRAQDELLVPLSSAERIQLNALLRRLIERSGEHATPAPGATGSTPTGHATSIVG